MNLWRVIIREAGAAVALAIVGAALAFLIFLIP